MPHTDLVPAFWSSDRPPVGGAVVPLLRTCLPVLWLAACGVPAPLPSATKLPAPSAAPTRQTPATARLATSTPSASNTPRPTPTLPAAEPQTLKIAFVSGRSGNLDIYVMSADGSCVNWLTRDPSQESDPAYSVRAQRLAFTSDRVGNREIYVMDSSSLLYGANDSLLGGTITRITDDPGEDHSPSFFPDGEAIAFVSTRDGNEEIYLSDLITQRAARLTDHPAADNTPAISPDGRRIAFSSSRTGAGDIYLMNRDGSDLIRITEHPANDAAPAWSSDGLRIAFMSQRDGNWEIYSMNADGTDATRLTDHPASDQYPSWAGQQIAFMSSRRGDFEVYLMNAGGTSATRLTLEPSLDGYPEWASSDDPGPITTTPAAPHSAPRSAGGQIFFQSDGAAGQRASQLFVMNPDGGEPQQVTHLTVETPSGPFDTCPAARAAHPDWSSPLGRLLFTSDLLGGTLAAVFGMNLDGSGLRQISGPRPDSMVEDAISAAGSPDGQWVAFLAFDRLGDIGVFLIRPDGSEEREITYGAIPGRLSWSPDSRRIAFARRDKVILLDVQTSREEELTAGIDPAWSRDATQIALNRAGRLYLVAVDGSGEMFLTDGEAPAWSPDGHWIVFQRRISGQYDLFKIRVDGTELTRLTDTSRDEVNPDWD